MIGYWIFNGKPTLQSNVFAAVGETFSHWTFVGKKKTKTNSRQSLVREAMT